MPEPADEATVAILGAICRYAAELVGASPAPLQQIRVHAGDLSVELSWPADGAVHGGWSGGPQRGAEPGTSPPRLDADPLDSEHQVVRAPTVGAFYRRPEPGADPFVELNDIVEAGQQLGILEAMKLMNPIVAEVACRIVVILAEDGVSVEHGQPLFTVEPC